MADPATTKDMVDLAHKAELTWGANPFTSESDVVLVYRCAPYSDIAYAFTAMSEPRATKPSDGTDSPYAINLAAKVPLINPVTLRELKHETLLQKWSFVRNQQGVMRRKLDLTAEGVWPIVSRIIQKKNPHFEHSLLTSRKRLHIRGPLSKKSRNCDILNVFISYPRKDRDAAKSLYTKLRQEGFIDPWFDLRNLAPGDVFEKVIVSAIKKCEAAVIIVSPNIRPNGFIHKEIGLLSAKFRRTDESSPCIFPAKIVPCSLPATLSCYHYVELYKPGVYDSIVAQLARKARIATSRRKRKNRARTA